MPSAPECPVCARAAIGPADTYAVYRCPSCKIRFRPPRRVPIRRVGVGTSPSPAAGKLPPWLLAVFIAGGVGAALATHGGQHEPPPSFDSTALDFDPGEFEPIIDPKLLDPLLLEPIHFDADFDPSRTPLETTIHRFETDDRITRVTGLVQNPGERRVEAVRVELQLLAPDGSDGAAVLASTACRRLDPGAACAFAVEAPTFARERTTLTATARAHRGADVFEPVVLVASFDSEGRPEPASAPLRLDGDDLHITLTDDRGLHDAWITATSFDARGEVLDVRVSAVTEALLGGRRFTRALARPDPLGVRVEVRVDGIAPNLSP